MVENPTNQINHFVGGRRTAGRSDRGGAVYDPATGQQTGRVAFADPPEVEHAVKVARQALATWSSVSPAERARVMFAYRQLLQEHREELAETVAREHGKLLGDARGEVNRGIEVVEYACGAPSLLSGNHNQVGSGTISTHSLRQPLGVVAGITPFNFPAMVPLWMYPIALVCGNTFVLKPSERDPSVSLLLAELLRQAGLPDGALNVVQGDRETAQALMAHPDVQAVSFVGSTPAAEAIYRTATAGGKRVQALGGAKNHLVVMPDAPIQQAADGLVAAAYGSAGQRCMAVPVAVAVGESAEPLLSELVSRVGELTLGAWDDPEAHMGPLVSAEAVERVTAYVNEGVAEGAELVVDGRGRRAAGHESGFFIGPSLFDHVATNMRIYREEIFGPVLCVVRVSSYAEALSLVNDHEFGNGAIVFTRDGGIAHDFSVQVQAGMVGINVPIPVPVSYHSFGGWKRSLFGDHHVYGSEGVRFYTRLKTITSRWHAPDPDPGQTCAGRRQAASHPSETSESRARGQESAENPGQAQPGRAARTNLDMPSGGEA